jgi:hypothetical protein
MATEIDHIRRLIDGNEDVAILVILVVGFTLTLVYKGVIWTRDDWIDNQAVTDQHFGLCLLSIPTAGVFLGNGRILSVNAIHAFWSAEDIERWNYRVLPLLKRGEPFWKTRKRKSRGIRRSVQSSVDIAIC